MPGTTSHAARPCAVTGVLASTASGIVCPVADVAGKHDPRQREAAAPWRGVGLSVRWYERRLTRSGEAMPMAGGPVPGPLGGRAYGSSPVKAGALVGRAWLAALPDELAAQRRVITGLADLCEAWPLAASLLVGCSLGRGAADALSDIDAALGIDAPCGAAGAERVGTAEAMVVAALPELGGLIDVLRHRTGPADQWVRRIFAQFADGTQLDLTVVAQAGIEARRRGGGAPDFIPVYQVPAPLGSVEPDARTPASGSAPGGAPPAAYAVTGEQVREWAFLGWCALIDTDKYLRRLALGSPQPAARGTPPRLGAVGGGARRHVPMARPVAGARPRPREPAARHRVHRGRP